MEKKMGGYEKYVAELDCVFDCDNDNKQSTQS
jgi:hypothetical protein